MKRDKIEARLAVSLLVSTIAVIKEGVLGAMNNTPKVTIDLGQNRRTIEDSEYHPRRRRARDTMSKDLLTYSHDA